MLFLSFDERWNSISNNDAWGFLAESNCWYTCGRNPMVFFYILSFKEEALSLNHLNRAIRFIAISYMYHPDENTNKSHNLNTATRSNVLYESFFSNWLNRVYICSFPYIYRTWSRIQPGSESCQVGFFLRILSSGFFLLPLTQICVFCTLQYEQRIKTEGVFEHIII